MYGYSACSPPKAAVVNLSQLFRAELRPRDTAVPVLRPPDTDTAVQRQEIEQLPPQVRAIHATSTVLTAERVAESLVSGLAGGRFEIVPERLDRALVRLHRVRPVPLRAACDAMVRRSTRRSAGRTDDAR